MRYEPGLKEDAKNLSIVAGSAAVAALLTAAFVSARLHPAQARATPVEVEPPAIEAPHTDQPFIFIEHGHNGRRDLHVVVIRTGSRQHVVTVSGSDRASAADSKDGSGARRTR